MLLTAEIAKGLRAEGQEVAADKVHPESEDDQGDTIALMLSIDISGASGGGAALAEKLVGASFYDSAGRVSGVTVEGVPFVGAAPAAAADAPAAEADAPAAEADAPAAEADATAAAADAPAAAPAPPPAEAPAAASAAAPPVDESADGATAPTRMCVVTWNAGEAEVNKRAIKQTCDAIGMNDCRILATRKDKQKENRLVVLFNSVEAARCFAEKYAEWCPDGRRRPTAGSGMGRRRAAHESGRRGARRGEGRRAGGPARAGESASLAAPPFPDAPADDDGGAGGSPRDDGADDGSPRDDGADGGSPRDDDADGGPPRGAGVGRGLALDAAFCTAPRSRPQPQLGGPHGPAAGWLPPTLEALDIGSDRGRAGARVVGVADLAEWGRAAPAAAAAGGGWTLSSGRVARAAHEGAYWRFARAPSANAFTGGLPAGWARLTRLTSLRAVDCGLDGPPLETASRRSRPRAGACACSRSRTTRSAAGSRRSSRASRSCARSTCGRPASRAPCRPG